MKVYAFLSQIIPYADRELEMLYSFGRFLLPHLPLDRDTTVVKVGDEVALQYYRLERVFSGAIDLCGGRAAYVKSPTEVGTGKAQDEKAPLSEIIEVLNERFGTALHRGGPALLPADQGEGLQQRAGRADRPGQPARQVRARDPKLIEDLMIERMGENDAIVTRYMADKEFQGSAFPILAREIFEAVRSKAADPSTGGQGDPAEH